jgi:hypothetical protein
LHSASAAGGAQFYISCAQINVTDGGSGSPSPLVAFPGAYKASDPVSKRLWLGVRGVKLMFGIGNSDQYLLPGSVFLHSTWPETLDWIECSIEIGCLHDKVTDSRLSWGSIVFDIPNVICYCVHLK